jgi:hypothetical protein
LISEIKESWKILTLNLQLVAFIGNVKIVGIKGAVDVISLLCFCTFTFSISCPQQLINVLNSMISEFYQVFLTVL